jgi:hypothetical protein
MQGPGRGAVLDADRAGVLAGSHGPAAAGPSGAGVASSRAGGVGAATRDGRGRAVLGPGRLRRQTDTIELLRLEGTGLLDVERWTYRDELCHALEAPVWERFGTFVVIR